MSVVLENVVLPLAHFALDVNVSMQSRTTAIYGPSGSGKTSLLEVIAGLRDIERGRVLLHDRDVTHVPPRARKIGYMPQDDALFPHLSVRRNITYGGALADDVVRVLDIAHLLDRDVQRLSGGEKKRVALARALLSRPVVLLLDEPLAGIDPGLRARILEYFVRVRDEFPVPMIYVTHELDEASVVCEEIVVLESGKLVAQRALSRQHQ